MPPLSIMIKPASALCNLRCKYCFYRNVAENRKQNEYGIMTRENAKTLIEKALHFADGAPVSFAFQGGEPTLAGLDYFRNFVSDMNEINKNRSPVFLSLQTNGTLINGEWAEFLAKNKFLTGLSLDGDFDANRFRKDENGKNSFYKILKAADTLKKHGAEYNILAVLTGYSARNGKKIYNFFKSEGFKNIQFIPCLKPFGYYGESNLFMTVREYGDFLCDVFSLYAEDYKKGRYISVRQFDNWVRLYLGGAAEQCGMNGFCARQFVCESNGNIYPCDFYCTDEYLLGNIKVTNFEEIAFCDTAKKFIESSANTPETCKSCEYINLCRAGGCKRTRQSADYCGAYKKFFKECLPLFKYFESLKQNNI